MQTFNRVDENIKIKDLDGGLYLFIYAFTFSILLAISINFFHPLISVVILILAFLVGRNYRRYLPDYLNEKKIIGTLSFTDDELSFDTKLISFEKIKSIKLHTNYVQGEKFTTKDIVHNGLGSILIKEKDGTSTSIKFILATTDEWKELKRVLEKLYLKEIEVKEFLFNHELKSILLNPDWTYEEIQQLKKDLKVSDFYK